MNPELVELVKKGSDAIKAFRKQNPSVALDLTKADLTKADLTKADLTEADLTGAQLFGANLTGAKLFRADLNMVTLIGAKLNKADLKGAHLIEANLSHADLTGANLKWTRFNDAVLTGANLTGANLSQADLTGANLTGADLTGANLSGATFLPNAITGSTKFSIDTKFDGASISRKWATILLDSGAITKLDLASMTVVDPIRKLRAAYSGFQWWLQVIAVATFLFPYFCFVAKSLVMRKWYGDDREAHISMLEALWRFIWTGGRISEYPSFDFWAVGSFTLLIAYNALRIVLLWQVKKLELEEQISGLPVDIPPDSLVARWFKRSQWLFLGSLVLVAVHTVRFLLLPVPPV